MKMFKRRGGITARSNRRADARRTLRPRGVTLSLLALFGASTLPAVQPPTAHAQENDERFDIASVLVEDGEDSRIDARDTAIDPAGNRYVVGNLVGTVEFGEGRTAEEVTGTVGDVFVARYDVNEQLNWVRKFDAGSFLQSPRSEPVAIVYDERFDRVIIGGTFEGSLTFGRTQLTGTVRTSSFLAQLDPLTGEPNWANRIIGNDDVEATAIAADGNIAVTGSFSNLAEFRDHFGAVESRESLAPDAAPDMFTALYATDGSLDFVLQAGGAGAEGSSVSFAPGRIFVGGDFRETIRFPDRNGGDVETLNSNGAKDGFLVVYNRNGAARLARGFGGSGFDAVRQVVARSTVVYVAGNFREEMRLGERTLVSRGGSDVYLAQVSAIDGAVDRSSHIGGEQDDFVHSMDKGEGSRGQLFLGGEFRSSSLEVGSGGESIRIEHPNTTFGGDTFLAGFDAGRGGLRPNVGQAVSGTFVSRGLGVDERGENAFLSGHYRGALTFGEGDTRLELTAPLGERALAVARFSPSEAPSEPPVDLVFSTNRAGQADGVRFRNEDVLLFSDGRQRIAMLIDGSDLGLAAVDVDAVHRQEDGSFLLSVSRSLDLPALGSVSDSDVLLFAPEQLGEDTRGALSVLHRGIELGLDTRGEDIDALSVDAAGRLLVSVVGNARVPGPEGTLVARDEDVLVREGEHWELAFDGSANELDQRSEDIKAVSLEADGLLFSTQGAYGLREIDGDGNDILACSFIGAGPAAGLSLDRCDVRFDGDDKGFDDVRVDAVSGGR